jgi:protease I
MKKMMPFLVVGGLIIVTAFTLFIKSKAPSPGKVTPTTTSPIEKGGEEKMALSGKNILMVVAPQNFRDEEAMEPKKILEENGAQISIASKGVSEAKGMLGAVLKVDQDLNQVDPQAFDGVIFVGGTGASVYFNDERILNLAKNFSQQGKLVAAICIAPSILANAQLLEGKRATAFSSEKGNLESKGAVYTGEEITLDGSVITAKGPEAASEFARAIIEYLRKGE